MADYRTATQRATLMEKPQGRGKPRMTGSPIEVMLVMFVAIAVIHALVTPPADTRWRDEIVRAMLELEAKQRLAHPELESGSAPAPGPAPERFIEVSVVEPESPHPGGHAPMRIDREQVRDWSDDSSAPSWSAKRDPRISAAEAGGEGDGQRRTG